VRTSRGAADRVQRDEPVALDWCLARDRFGRLGDLLVNAAQRPLAWTAWYW